MAPRAVVGPAAAGWSTRRPGALRRPAGHRAFVVDGVHNAALRNVIHVYVAPDHHARAWAYYSVMANVCIAAGFVLGTPWGPVSSQVLVVLAGALPRVATLLGMRSLAALAARDPTVTVPPDHRAAEPSR